MKPGLGYCPECGSMRVRTGKDILRHLLRVSKGTPCRYCRDCHFRWLASVMAFSPFLWLIRHIVQLALLLMAGTWMLSQLHDARLVRLRYQAMAAAGTAAAPAAPRRSYNGIYADVPGETGYGPYRIARPTAHTGTGDAVIPGFAGNGRWAGKAAQGPSASQEILRMVQMLILNTGRTPRQIAAEIDSTSKEDLWRKYGSHFSSKQEAEEAYKKFQEHRNEIVW